MSFQEILDLVSSDDTVVGQATKEEVYQKGYSNFRVINGFVINSDGKLWIPRRHKEKRLFPLHLDCSVGGHVMAGEAYEAAFARETEEELRIDVQKAEYKVLERLTPQTHNTSAFMWVYGIYQDEAPEYERNDFTEYYWLTVDEVFDRLQKGDKGKGDLPKILEAIRSRV